MSDFLDKETYQKLLEEHLMKLPPKEYFRLMYGGWYPDEHPAVDPPNWKDHTLDNGKVFRWKDER